MVDLAGLGYWPVQRVEHQRAEAPGNPLHATRPMRPSIGPPSGRDRRRGKGADASSYPASDRLLAGKPEVELFFNPRARCRALSAACRAPHRSSASSPPRPRLAEVRDRVGRGRCHQGLFRARKTALPRPWTRAGHTKPPRYRVEVGRVQKSRSRKRIAMCRQLAAPRTPERRALNRFACERRPRES